MIAAHRADVRPKAWEGRGGNHSEHYKVHGTCHFKSAYKWEEGVCLGEVMDFPGTVSCSSTVNESRENLAEAQRDMAETKLLRGEPLPISDEQRTDHDADLEEPIYLLLQTGQQLSQQVTAPAP